MTPAVTPAVTTRRDQDGFHIFFPLRDRPAAEAMLRELRNDLWVDQVRGPAD